MIVSRDGYTSSASVKDSSDLLKRKVKGGARWASGLSTMLSKRAPLSFPRGGTCIKCKGQALEKYAFPMSVNTAVQAITGQRNPRFNVILGRIKPKPGSKRRLLDIVDRYMY